MARRIPKILHVLLLSALVTAGCSSNMVKSLTALNALRQHLIQKYGDEVSVSVQNSRYLLIAFINSPLNKADSAKRFERAQDAARFVARNFEQIQSIEQVWISFVAAQRRLIVYQYIEGIQSFGFRNNGTPLIEEGVTPEDPRAPITRFSAAKNQTDISVTRIQLDGDMKKGIALVPHFQVDGDARQGRVAPPESVVFDFASYSDNPLFADKTSLEIYCDDQLTIKGFAQLLSKDQSGTEETIAQFLTARIPFRGFYRMGISRKLRIHLGTKRFDLSPEDIEAIRKMTAYVGLPPETTP